MQLRKYQLILPRIVVKRNYINIDTILFNLYQITTFNWMCRHFLNTRLTQ